MHRELADLGLVDFDYVYGDAVMGPNHEDAACMHTPRGQRRAKERERRGEEHNVGGRTRCTGGPGAGVKVVCLFALVCEGCRSGLGARWTLPVPPSLLRQVLGCA